MVIKTIRVIFCVLYTGSQNEKPNLYILAESYVVFQRK
jgi:hypothetical protein